MAKNNHKFSQQKIANSLGHLSYQKYILSIFVQTHVADIPSNHIQIHPVVSRFSQGTKI